MGCTNQREHKNNSNAETLEELAGRVEVIPLFWRTVSGGKWKWICSLTNMVPTVLSPFAGWSRKISELQFEFLHADRQRAWKARKGRHCEPGKSCKATPEQRGRVAPWRKKGRQKEGFSWKLKRGEECALEQWVVPSQSWVWECNNKKNVCLRLEPQTSVLASSSTLFLKQVHH